MPQITIGSIIYHYRMSKRVPADGCAVICIHGSGTSSIVWSYQISRLSKYFKIIAPDLPGHGESGGHTLPSAEAYARWLNRFLEELRLPSVYLCGHSFGGAIVQEYARIYPHKVKGLVLIGTGMSFKLSKLYRKLTAQGSDPAGALPLSELPDFFRKGYELLSSISNQTLHDDLLAAGDFDSAPWIGSLHVPALVVWGSNDIITPVEVPRELAVALPAATLQIIQDAGHVVMVDSPEAFNNVLNKFLKSINAPLQISEL